jgi:hypothetical protein
MAVLAAADVAAAAAATAGAGPPVVAGTWTRLPPAPIAPEEAAAAWTGRSLFAFGRDQRVAHDSRGDPYSAGSTNVAAVYDGATRRWRRLAPPRGPGYSPRPLAAWTGREALVWGAFDRESYTPSTERWRLLPPAPTARGFAVWSGRELIGWGGGCCGDAFTSGSAYDPATGRWRTLPPSPLAGSQHPAAAWTGRELVIVVGGTDPATGRPFPARRARGAAYDPAANRWHRIARPPGPREGAAAAWDGREVVLAGGSGRAGRASTAAFAYDPAGDRWRRLPSLPSARSGAVAVRAGRRVLLVAGGSPTLAYDPASRRWSRLPPAPLPARLVPTAVWTGRSMIVWGVLPTGSWGRYRAAGAVFTPAP